MPCYSDHNEDIRLKGSCDYCHGTEPDPPVPVKEQTYAEAAPKPKDLVVEACLEPDVLHEMAADVAMGINPFYGGCLSALNGQKQLQIVAMLIYEVDKSRLGNVKRLAALDAIERIIETIGIDVEDEGTFRSQLETYYEQIADIVFKWRAKYPPKKKG